MRRTIRSTVTVVCCQCESPFCITTREFNETEGMLYVCPDCAYSEEEYIQNGEDDGYTVDDPEF